MTIPHCGRVLGRAEGIIRRLPTVVPAGAGALHRQMDDARASRRCLTSCPGCHQQLQRRNRAN